MEQYDGPCDVIVWVTQEETATLACTMLRMRNTSGPTRIRSVVAIKCGSPK